MTRTTETETSREVAVVPSLLAADFTRLRDEVGASEEAGVSGFHLDVMDGHFVPNLTMGPLIVEAIRKLTRRELEVHLMITDPCAFARDFRSAGADVITFHVEAVGPRRVEDAIARVRETGARVGLAFNPDTDHELWHRYVAQADLALLMTVYPGFGGQSFISQVRPRIRTLRAAFPELVIGVDGGINRHTIPLVRSDGADRLVCGTAFFGEAQKSEFVRWASSSAAPSAALQQRTRGETP